MSFWVILKFRSTEKSQKIWSSDQICISSLLKVSINWKNTISINWISVKWSFPLILHRHFGTTKLWMNCHKYCLVENTLETKLIYFLSTKKSQRRDFFLVLLLGFYLVNSSFYRKQIHFMSYLSKILQQCEVCLTYYYYWADRHSL